MTSKAAGDMVTCRRPGCGRVNPNPLDLDTWHDCPCGAVYLVPDDPADIYLDINQLAEMRGVETSAIRVAKVERFTDLGGRPDIPFWTHLYWLWVEESGSQPVITS